MQHNMSSIVLLGSGPENKTTSPTVRASKCRRPSIGFRRWGSVERPSPPSRSRTCANAFPVHGISYTRNERWEKIFKDVDTGFGERLESMDQHHEREEDEEDDEETEYYGP